MKSKLIVILIMALTGVSASAQEFLCTSTNDKTEVNINIDGDNSSFNYSNGSQINFTFNMPSSSISFANVWETGRTYINFNPGWGESTVNIYARISLEEKASLFDIYAKGMATGGFAVIRTLVEFTCKEVI